MGKTRPALSPEAKQNQLISLAVAQAERDLRAGKASSQVVTHFLKLGTVQAQLELEREKLENELIKAKTEALQSAKNTEEMYAKAIDAFMTYSGRANQTSEDEDYDE